MNDMVDPDDHLKWLLDTLLLAERNDEKVHLIGHIPPSYTPDCTKQWSKNFYKIVDRFSETIVAQFYGHTHIDLFQVITDSGNFIEGDAIATSWISPSLTTYDGGLPAIRTFKTDQEYKIIDFNTFKPVDGSADGENVPEWELSYNGLSYFEDVSPNGLRDFLQKVWEDDDKFSEFYELVHKHSIHHKKSCLRSTKCKKKFICQFTKQHSFDSCVF